MREVYLEEDTEHWFSHPCYTYSEAAMALGRNRLTLKRWVDQDLVPPPIHFDCTHNNAVYLEEEVKAICAVLRRHERTYDYFTYKHEDTIEDIRRSVERVRD